MKVTVTTYLNVRVGKPSVNAPCYQCLAPGSEIEVDGNLYRGDPYEHNDLWLKDEAGNYYWSGGIKYKTDFKVAPPATEQYWWLNDYHIPYLHSQGLTGKGVKIAVLDTGVCLTHPALNLNSNLLKDVTNSPSGVNDIYGHGTHCVGIINASKGEYGELGIAPDALIYVCKITRDYFGDETKYLVRGIQWALEQKVDIISISKGSTIDYGSSVEEKIDKAIGEGILLVCAAGNKIGDKPYDHICYPARYNNVISVGGVDQEKKPIKDSILTGETKIFAPGENILSTYLNNTFESLSGSSQAAPYIAGVCALMLQHQRIIDQNYKAIHIINIIQSVSDCFSDGWIINPLKII